MTGDSATAWDSVFGWDPPPVQLRTTATPLPLLLAKVTSALFSLTPIPSGTASLTSVGHLQQLLKQTQSILYYVHICLHEAEWSS